MKLEWYLARQYFAGNRKGARFLSFIKIMAIAGIALGAGGLLLALAITHGFSEAISEKLFSFGGHVRIQALGTYPVYRSDTLDNFVEVNYPVATAEPAVLGQCMIQHSKKVEGTFIQGITDDVHYNYIEQFLSAGSADIFSLDQPAIVLGQTLAGKLDAEIGEKVTLFAFSGIRRSQNIEIGQFQVVGIYATEIEELDDVLGFIKIDEARNLFGYGPAESTFIEARIQNPAELWEVDAVLNDGRLFPFTTENIYETYSNIFAWIALQENTIPFVIAVMVIVAAFNLIGAILMMILERTKDIGILRTLGIAASKVRRVFIIEGLIVASVGLLIGVGVAYGFFLVEEQFHFISLPQENYYMSYAPFKPLFSDLLIVSAVTLMLSFLASMIPSRVAANIDPVKVLSFGK